MEIRLKARIAGARFRPLAGCLLLILVVSAVLDAFVIEPVFYRVREISFSKKPALTVVHISDLHYKGERRYLASVIKKVNSIIPDFVCFTGDIVEEPRYLKGALAEISRLRCPIYGVPGNHDPRVKERDDAIGACLAGTGGAWLLDQTVAITQRNVAIVGGLGAAPEDIPLKPGHKRILLVHHPESADKANKGAFDLILAGHSHGGQVRLPLYGALILPYGVGPYERGLYRTPAGPLYVNPGIGTWNYRVRFFCRPEITVFYL